MPISFSCSQCGKQYRNVRDDYAGKRLKCKCGAINRAPSLQTADSSGSSLIDPLGLPTPTTQDLLTPIQGSGSVEDLPAGDDAVGVSSSAPVKNAESYWGKPRVQQVVEESETQEVAAKAESLSRRKAQQKTGPILTRVSCGLSALVCFITCLLTLMGGVGLLILIASPQESQKLSAVGIALGIANCVVTFFAAGVFYKFSFDAFRESFSRSKRIRNSTLASAKAGASAMVFAGTTLVCSLVSLASLIGHVVTDKTGKAELVGPIALNFGTTFCFVAVAAFVYFVGRYRHGSVKLKHFHETSAIRD